MNTGLATDRAQGSSQCGHSKLSNPLSSALVVGAEFYICPQ